MGLLDSLRGSRRNDSPVAVLTPLGKTKLEKPGVPEYQWRILNHLSECGPSNIQDMSQELGMSGEKTKAICTQLERDGFISRRQGGAIE